jgi:hypothetical protein
MKKQIKLVLIGIIISYLAIGLVLDRYSDYKLSQTESFLEGVSRETDKYGPGHIISILFWPFYL